MEFRTPISIQSQQPKIDYDSKIFLLGSCFVENIGDKLEYYKLQNYRNPFGILYHPAALEGFLKKAGDSFTFSEADIFLYNERWHSFDSHSDLSDPDADTLLVNLNKNLRQTREYLENASHSIITLGTAWGYRSRVSQDLVANCHKLPQKEFTKELMEIPEIEACLKSIIQSIIQINPELTIIFTISPVRHIKDGITGNQRSKAHLISALHNLLEKGNDSINRLHYFPAYEILMDDLRDYRFYADDMLHPSAAAILYIWNKFTESWFSESAVRVLKEVEAIQRGLAHRPFNPESNAHRKFFISLQEKIKNIKSQYPHLEF